MADCDEARELLAAADKDLTALRGMADPKIFADEVFGFHAQQGAEKALKAWLCLLGLEYPRTHDLTLLLSILQDHGRDVEALYGLIDLNPYAVQFRYGAFEGVRSPLDRSVATQRVAALFRMVEGLIDSASG